MSKKPTTIQYKGFLKALNKIEGYPLSIKFEWFQQSNACQAERSPKKKERVDFSNGLEGAAMSMVGNFLDKQKDKIIGEWQKDALVRYIYEATYHLCQRRHGKRQCIQHTLRLRDG